MINILLAEPSYIIRKGIHLLLEQFPEIHSVTEISEPLSCQAWQDSSAEHQIIILNTNLISGLSSDITECLKESEAHILYLTNSTLAPESPNNQLSVMDSKSVLIQKIEHYIKMVELHEKQEGDSDDELSQRERDILQQVALGKTNKEIANTLFISTHTVITHRKNITRKLGIKTVAGLTVYAILNNLIQMEDIA